MNLDELEALAKAATPGPWRMETGAQPFHEILGSVLVGPVDFDDLCDDQRMISLPNAAFIAAANPATVLVLIARLHATEALVERAWRESVRCSGGDGAAPSVDTAWANSDAKAELDRLRKTT